MHDTAEPDPRGPICALGGRRATATDAGPPLPAGLTLYTDLLTPALLAALRVQTERLRWRQHDVRVFGRTHPMPRLTCFLAPSGMRYRYSGVEHVGCGVPEVFASLLAEVRAHSAQEFDSILCSHYRDGADRVGWHADDEAQLGARPVVAVFSLGAERPIRFRPRPDAGRRGAAVALALPSNSLLVMAAGFQSHWQHAVPARRGVGARTSFSFRALRLSDA